MATKDGPSTGSTPEVAPHREEFADFALVLNDGCELKCHKVKLAEVSPVFCAMLRQDCVETQSNKMKVSEFETDTVKSFLDWIYAEMEVRLVRPWYVECHKYYDSRRLTPDLLRLSHMYQVKTLEDACLARFLKESYINNDMANEICEIWTVAETIGHARLKTVVLQYLAKKRDKLLKVPGIKECFKNPRLMESLVTYMSGREKVVTVKVQCWDYHGLKVLTTQKVRVKLSDTVKVLRFRINGRLEKWTDEGCAYRCEKKSIGSGETIPPWHIVNDTPLNFFPEDCTLDEIGYKKGITWTDGRLLECIIVPSDDDDDDDGQDDGQADGQDDGIYGPYGDHYN